MKTNNGAWDDIMSLPMGKLEGLVEDKTNLKALVNTANASRKAELFLLMAEQLTDSIRTGDGMLTPEQVLFVGSTL
jgi:hypothetical protein